ncbi:MAG TPA: TetR/AcrR family transcriptional regulator [Acetobacteraceae bacterium]|nr:TetR/AcrR family transcriptional regulator [Acetobacteraceae bacterium]
MAAPEALSREKREAILDGATRIFADRGYEGASMSMITAAAGVSKGTIYQHFGGKAALFGATIGRECEQRLVHLFATLDDSRDVAETLHSIGTRFLSMLTDPAIVAVERAVASEAERFPELAQAFFASGPARAIGAMARYLKSQAEVGRLRIPDAPFAAEQFFSLCQTRVVLRTRLRLPVPAGEAERVIDEAVRVFLAAYTA